MNIWERIRPPSGIEEIKEEALRKASRSSEKISYKGRIITAKKREKVRIETTYNTLKKHIERSIRIMKTYYTADLFYKDLIKLYFPEEELRKALKRLEGSKRVLDKLRKEYIDKIDRVKNTEKARDIRREALGRMLSILKRQRKQILLSREIWKYARKLPSINFDEPIVIVSGPPNVGKSSLINKLSNTELTIASYPFTTKKIHVGHLETRFSRIQFIDTPGLLDRPLKERNDVEMQAILALRHLPGLVIYMLDPSPERFYESEKQISIFKEIIKLFKEKSYVIVINKIDVEDVDFREILKGEDIHRISILEDMGIEEVKRRILNHFNLTL